MVIDIHPCEMERFNRDFAAFVERLSQKFREQGHSEAEIQRATYEWHESTVESYWRNNQHRYLRTNDQYGWRRWNAEAWLSEAQKWELDRLYDVTRDETVAGWREQGFSRQEIDARLAYHPGEIAHEFWKGLRPRYMRQARRAA